MYEKTKPTTRRWCDLGEILTELFDLPRDPKGWPVEGNRIARAVFKAISNALHKGDYVQVEGFGKFLVYNTPARMRNALFQPVDEHGKPLPLLQELIHEPARKRAVFQPAEPLKAQLNLTNKILTADERKTIARYTRKLEEQWKSSQENLSQGKS